MLSLSPPPLLNCCARVAPARPGRASGGKENYDRQLRDAISSNSSTSPRATRVLHINVGACRENTLPQHTLGIFRSSKTSDVMHAWTTLCTRTHAATRIVLEISSRNFRSSRLDCCAAPIHRTNTIDRWKYHITSNTAASATAVGNTKDGDASHLPPPPSPRETRRVVRARHNFRTKKGPVGKWSKSLGNANERSVNPTELYRQFCGAANNSSGRRRQKVCTNDTVFGLHPPHPC